MHLREIIAQAFYFTRGEGASSDAIVDAIAFDVEAHMQRETERLTAERDKWRNALRSLTVGGSEFSSSPERCVANVKEGIALVRKLAEARATEVRTMNTEGDVL